MKEREIDISLQKLKPKILCCIKHSFLQKKYLEPVKSIINLQSYSSLENIFSCKTSKEKLQISNDKLEGREESSY